MLTNTSSVERDLRLVSGEKEKLIVLKRTVQLFFTFFCFVKWTLNLGPYFFKTSEPEFDPVHSHTYSSLLVFNVSPSLCYLPKVSVPNNELLLCTQFWITGQVKHQQVLTGMSPLPTEAEVGMAEERGSVVTSQ